MIAEIWRLVKFAACGTAAAAVYVGSGEWLLAHIDSAAMAHTVAYLLSTATSFVLQRQLTFRATNDVATHLRRFVVLSATGWLMSGVLLAALMNAGMGEVPALLSVALAVPVLNYLAMRLWVFAEPRNNFS